MLVMSKGSYVQSILITLGKLCHRTCVLVGKCLIWKMGIILRIIIASHGHEEQMTVSAHRYGIQQEPSCPDPAASAVNHCAPCFHLLGLPRILESEPLSRKGRVSRSPGT